MKLDRRAYAPPATEAMLLVVPCPKHRVRNNPTIRAGDYAELVPPRQLSRADPHLGRRE